MSESITSKECNHFFLRFVPDWERLEVPDSAALAFGSPVLSPLVRSQRLI